MTNLVGNGSFETQTLATGTWKVSSTLSAWTPGPLGVELRNGVAGRAQDGLNFVELDTTANSYIVQDLLGATTSVTDWVTLSFWYSARPNTAAATNGLVFGFGTDLRSLAGLANSTTEHQWKQYSGNFFLSASDSLRFQAAGVSDGYGMSLDNVVVTSKIPEPGGLALVLAALVGMGTAASVRQRAWRKP